MKHLILFCFCALASMPVLRAQYRLENLTLESRAQVAQDQYKYQKLQLYPIRANNTFRSHHKDVAKYVTLKDALEKKKVVISEKSRSGTVNTLFIENVSNDTVIVLSGEVVQGGKQDRVIAQDFVLYPKSGQKDVSVFCVEHGRWSPKDGDTSFRQYFTICSNEIRKAATVNKNQQNVWDKVSETTDKNRANTSTGTLTALERSESFTKDLKQYIDHFQALAGEQDVIGVVAVTGSTILGSDMFATHEIFAQYLSSLLNSYATEAITSGKEVDVPYEKVEEYLKTILADESKQESEVEKKGTMLKDGNKKIHISTF